MLAVGVLVEKLHCDNDARSIVEAGRPAADILAELSGFDPVVSEHGHPPARILRWRIEELSAENIAAPVGDGLVCSVLVIGRDPSVTESDINSVLEQVRGPAGAVANYRRRCSYDFRRYLWNFVASLVILVPAIFIPGTLAFAFTPNPVPLFVIIGATILSVYIFTRWSQQNRLRQQRKVWGAVLTQGDADGTIRRALASIGIHLPESEPTP